MKQIILFDVDGTITESGQKISTEMANILNQIKNNGFEIGIVGGGKMEKIIEQMDGKIFFHHYFSECGCVYYKNNNNLSLELKEIYKKNIREHELYTKINILVKLSLNFLSNVDYTITGNFIDLRNGIIYISLIGLVANLDERSYFLSLDAKNNYRKKLLSLLHEKVKELNILEKVDIVEGGSVGIAIYPSEYDKIQVLEYFSKDEYEKIYYFGDKYEINGNDYKIINHHNVIGFKTDNPECTLISLSEILFF
jgi:HAD superfamily hydrolase (TIGR01484 family)